MAVLHMLLHIATMSLRHVCEILQELVAALADECDQSAIPSEYGGTSPTPLYESQIEKELSDFVHNMG